MNLYAESSAVLAWIADEPAGEVVRAALSSADRVVASILTLVECERVLVRSAVAGYLREDDFVRRCALLEAAMSSWNLLELGPEVLERSRRRFPGEPLRTLDALHVATALSARSAIPDLALLSLDQRVRESGAALGFKLLPV
jgi:predicted nucleic acid-binding protein